MCYEKIFYVRRNAQNLDEMGVFEKAGSMKSGVFDVLRGAKKCDESEKSTRYDCR